MIERLQRVIERIEQLPPDQQESVAEQIEMVAEPFLPPMRCLPRPSYAGIWSDLPDDMEEVLDRWRHEVPPTPPIEDESL
jgi:hypothetical protein